MGPLAVTRCFNVGVEPQRSSCMQDKMHAEADWAGG